MENAKEIRDYLKILNPKNETMTNEDYKAWQKATAENNEALCEKFMLLAYFDACQHLATVFICEDKSLEEFKDAAQDAFLFVSTFKPVTKHFSNYKTEVNYYLSHKIKEKGLATLRHNKYLQGDWTANMDAIGDNESETIDAMTSRKDAVERILKVHSSLPATIHRTKNKQYLLRYCGFNGENENMREIAEKEGVCVSSVQSQISDTVEKIRRKSTIRKMAKDFQM